MARLGGLLPTPRAAKRMVNIYRLVRIGIPQEELTEFTGDEKGGPYQASLVLLAILTGSPAVAEDVFRVLMDSPRSESMLSVLQKIAQSGSVLQQTVRKIESELITLEVEAGLSLAVSDCQRWCPVLARFSFHTRDLASSSAEQRLFSSKSVPLDGGMDSTISHGPIRRTGELTKLIAYPLNSR
jgi:hypothetical protein